MIISHNIGELCDFSGGDLNICNYMYVASILYSKNIT